MKTLIIALILLAAVPAFANTPYSEVISDLPLMQGMTEQTGDAVVFDQPSGRIVDVAAKTERSHREILEFYDSTLPPLGWTKTAASSYTRGSETLSIYFGEDNLVHFSIAPKGN